MPTGRVKWYEKGKGYGFVTSDDGGVDPAFNFEADETNACISYQQTVAAKHARRRAFTTDDSNETPTIDHEAHGTTACAMSHNAHDTNCRYCRLQTCTSATI